MVVAWRSVVAWWRGGVVAWWSGLGREWVKQHLLAVKCMFGRAVLFVFWFLVTGRVGGSNPREDIFRLHVNDCA